MDESSGLNDHKDSVFACILDEKGGKKFYRTLWFNSRCCSLFPCITLFFFFKKNGLLCGIIKKIQSHEDQKQDQIPNTDSFQLGDETLVTPKD